MEKIHNEELNDVYFSPIVVRVKICVQFIKGDDFLLFEKKKKESMLCTDRERV